MGTFVFVIGQCKSEKFKTEKTRRENYNFTLTLKINEEKKERKKNNKKMKKINLI